MDLQGKIEKFNVPEIFQLISSGRRTGTLGINRDDQAVMVYFKDGQITYAYSPNRRNRLGDRLVARQVIDSTQLEKTLLWQKESGGRKRLGAILIERQIAPKLEIELVLKEQITDTIYKLMTWDKGVFKFYDGTFPTEEDVTLSLSTENLILEGARRADELSRLKSKLPDFAAPLQIKQIMGNQTIELRLSASDWNVLSLCDGHRTIGKIISDSGADPIDSLKSIIKLIASGFLEQVNRSDNDIPLTELSDIEVKIDALADFLKTFLEKG
jgi:hypothetical protein